METTELNVQVARLEVQVGVMKSDVSEIKSDMKAQNRMLATLVAAEERRKGAKAVTRVFVAALTSGGFLGWLYEHFHK